jgi:surface polysaccharide O-acyltransferase-like enzyme
MADTQAPPEALTRAERAEPAQERTQARTYAPWVSWAKVFAIVGIVGIHVCGHLVLAWGRIDATRWHFGNLVDSAGRFGVPLFVLASGAMLLRPERVESVSTFYRKRAARIAAPLVVWTVFYLWFDAWTHGREVTAHTFVQGFLWGRPYYHLYFLYVVAGLYLVTPFLRVFVAHASRRLVGLAAAVCLALAIADKLQHTFMGGGGFNAFSYFVPWIGYYLLGYVVATVSLERWARRTVLVWSGVVFVGGVLVTAIGTWVLFGWVGPQLGRLLYEYFAPGVLLSAVAAAVFLRAWLGDARPVPAGGASPVGRRLADLTLGVFLLHPLPLQLFVRADQPVFGSDLADIGFHLGVIVALVVGCALVTAVVRLVPFVRRVV